MKQKITDNTGGLTNLFPPRVTYKISEHERTSEQIINTLLSEGAARTFHLSSIKEALENHKVIFHHNDKLAFLARHVAGGGHVLIEVVYKNKNNSEDEEEFVVTKVKSNDSIWPQGTIIAHGYN